MAICSIGGLTGKAPSDKIRQERRMPMIYPRYRAGNYAIVIECVQDRFAWHPEQYGEQLEAGDRIRVIGEGGDWVFYEIQYNPPYGYKRGVVNKRYIVPEIGIVKPDICICDEEQGELICMCGANRDIAHPNYPDCQIIAVRMPSPLPRKKVDRAGATEVHLKTWGVK